jgi:hypothetical protein
MISPVSLSAISRQHSDFIATYISSWLKADSFSLSKSIVALWREQVNPIDWRVAANTDRMQTTPKGSHDRDTKPARSASDGLWRGKNPPGGGAGTAPKPQAIEAG